MKELITTNPVMMENLNLLALGILVFLMGFVIGVLAGVFYWRHLVKWADARRG